MHNSTLQTGEELKVEIPTSDDAPKFQHLMSTCCIMINAQSSYNSSFQEFESSKSTTASHTAPSCPTMKRILPVFGSECVTPSSPKLDVVVMREVVWYNWLWQLYLRDWAYGRFSRMSRWGAMAQFVRLSVSELKYFGIPVEEWGDYWPASAKPGVLNVIMSL